MLKCCRPVLILVFIAAIFLIFTGCKKDDDCNCLYTAFVIDPPTLSFNYFEDYTTFELINKGDVSIDWNTLADSSVLELSANSGTLQPETSVFIDVIVKRSKLENGLDSTDITILINEDSIYIYQCFIQHHSANIIQLEKNVIDAEYNSKTDQLIFLSSNPNSINTYSSETEEMHAVALDHLPVCISIAGDLAKASILCEDQLICKPGLLTIVPDHAGRRRNG